MAFADEMQAVATQLLGEFGSADRVVLIKASGSPVWDAALGEYVAQSEQEIALTGVTIGANVGLINGTTIQAGDTLVAAAYSGIDITTADSLKIDGVKWSIVAVMPTDFSGTEICHKLQVRR